MNDQQRPLLVFPQPTSSEREKRGSQPPKLHIPTTDRQAERLTPKFGQLQQAFEARRIQLQAAAPTDEPDLVVVFETVGSVEKFFGAVRRIEGLEWLLEADEEGVTPDEDFFLVNNREKPLSGRVYLLGSNQQALLEVIRLWARYRNAPDEPLEHGFGKWKEVFKHLHDVRFWGVRDRIGQDVREFLEERLGLEEAQVRFEIEAWCYASDEKNRRAAAELTRLVGDLGGRVVGSALIGEIAYHGFLVEVPGDGVRQILSEAPPGLVQSERVMMFRARGQSLAPTDEEDVRFPAVANTGAEAAGPPIVALLDGLPLQNHPLLAGRLRIDDPDAWEAGYEALDRVHGTAMASLIARGDLNVAGAPLSSPIYVRPIMRPVMTEVRNPRRESTPDTSLLIDLVHRAVRRIFEADGDIPAVAPTVKVINLSVGDLLRPFDSELSPWARLLDWLASKYQVLFVVSAGNSAPSIELSTPRGSLSRLPDIDRQKLALAAIASNSIDRRILAPAESINALTVGATHHDDSVFTPAADRYDLFPLGGISPYSCVGHGFRRSVKPDILMPGGRILYRDNYAVGPGNETLLPVHSTVPPGHLVAAPIVAGNDRKYSRGTSNAAALASRGAARAHAAIEVLRAGSVDRLPRRHDAVLLKALLAHGASWRDLEAQIVNARPDITERGRQRGFVARFVGYGAADIDRAITCTEQRATLIGTGELTDGDALEFRVPIPPSLSAQVLWRRLTVTLAWMSPVNARHAKYRAARLWIKPPGADVEAKRQDADWQHALRGTLQHEVLEGDRALAFAEDADLVFKVNCAEDGGKLSAPVPFALCVTLEVGEGVNIPIYQEIRDRVVARVGVGVQ